MVSFVNFSAILLQECGDDSIPSNFTTSITTYFASMTFILQIFASVFKCFLCFCQNDGSQYPAFGYYSTLYSKQT